MKEEIYKMCEDQTAQIDCRKVECKFHKNGSCKNSSPAITLNSNDKFVCWSFKKPRKYIFNEKELIELLHAATSNVKDFVMDNEAFIHSFVERNNNK